MKRLFRIIIRCLILTLFLLPILPVRIVQASPDILTLRPNAVGDVTELTRSGGTYNWEMVDEVIADGATTRVYTQSTTYKYDLYNLPNHTIESGTINSVKIYFGVRSNNGSIFVVGRSAHKSGETTTFGTGAQTYSTDYSYFASETYTTNPATGNPYTWDEIDALQVGVALYVSDATYSCSCTQVYVEVDYTPITAPTVTTSAATNIASTTATLNGNVTATGGENPTVNLYWGTSDGGTNFAAWTDNSTPTSPSQPQGVAAFYKDATGLVQGTLYYFSASANNTGGTSWGTTKSFTTLGPPTVTSQAATLVEETTATWNGNITVVGSTSCDYRGFVWGTTSKTDPGDVAPASSGYDSLWYQSGSYGTGAYTYDVTALTAGTTWYFRAVTHNSYGWDYSNIEQTVYTKPEAPTGLTATAVSSVQIDLTWTKGTGSEKTMVRGKQGSYPTSVTDGYEVYFDTGTSDNDTGLSGGYSYYYRAWAWDTNSGYSDGYSQASATTMVGALSVVLWFQSNIMITGTTLPDRATDDGTQNGTIAWGSNPAGVTVSIGGITSYQSSTSSVSTDTIISYPLPEAQQPSGWFTTGIFGGVLTPELKESIAAAADSMGMPRRNLGVLIWFGLAVAIGLSVMIFTGSTFIALCIMIAVLWAGVNAQLIDFGLVMLVIILGFGSLYLVKQQ